jgi:predicted small lipoprotein YifL
VIRTDRLLSRIVVVGALAAALAAGGCGRKGSLDAPPGAAAVSQADETAPQNQTSQSGNLIDRGSPTGLPRVRGEDKRIPLDVLLN